MNLTTTTEFLLRRMRQERERVQSAACEEAREAHRALERRYAHRALAHIRDMEAGFPV